MPEGPLPEAYQLKITLVDSEPEVWRRVLVPVQVKLAELHDILQRAMGWQAQHDCAFRLGLDPHQAPASMQKTVGEWLSVAEGQPLYYLYDFHDGWLHRLEPERAIVAAGPEVNLPACLDGAAACPPEGSGGVWGYDELLARLEDPGDPDYMELIEKYSSLDPDAFDLAAAIARVAAYPGGG